MSNRTLKALYAMKAKGVDICGDLTISGDNDLFIGEGSAISSMVLDAEFVQGQFDDDDDFVAGTGAGDSHWLKITRNFGDVVYKQVKGVDDLLGLDNPADGKVESLPELKEQIERLQTAINAAKDSLRLAHQQEVSLMDAAFNQFLLTMKQQLIQTVTQIKAYADASDLAIAGWVGGADNGGILEVERMATITMFGDDRFCAERTVQEILDAGDSGLDIQIPLPIVYGGVDLGRARPELWDIRMKRKLDGGAKVFAVEVPHTVHVAGDKLNINIKAINCSGLYGGDYLVVSGICAKGAISEADDYGFGGIRDIQPNFSSRDAVAGIGTSFTHAEPMAEAEDGTLNSENEVTDPADYISYETE